MERCGRPLLEALAAPGADPRLPAEASNLLRGAARSETLHVLAARRQLRTIAELAGRHGYRPVILKGGVVVLDRDALDLADLDLLLPEGAAAEFAELLEREAGYTAPSPTVGERHLSRRNPVHGLPVEVHFRLGIQTGEPVEWPGRSPLRRLAPADHLRHLLAHTCRQHLRLRGRIRDLLLISRAAERCSSEDLRGIREWIESQPLAEVMARQLELARPGSSNAPAEAFTAEASALYLFAAWREGRGAPIPFYQVLREATLAVLAGQPDVAMRWREATIRTPDRGPSFRPWLRFLQERAPRIARLAVGFLRPARLAAAFLAAVPVALAARILARPTGDSVSAPGPIPRS